MQGEVTVADAASSRYRGRISTEIIRTVQDFREVILEYTEYSI